ncbi:transposable element Tcb1 transposase [Trichonephila clavipes]|nr:transposable element Tcb1 transposase [Trichonephila clavipes]
MPKEVEELVFVWASRLSPYPWVRFDYPFPFVIRSKNRGELQCLLKQLEVSEELGTVALERFQDDGNVSRCYSTGRPRVTTPNEDRYLAVTGRNRRSTASDLSHQLSSATGTTVLRQTVYRRLGHIGLYARRPVRSVPLTATHCHLRLGRGIGI